MTRGRGDGPQRSSSSPRSSRSTPRCLRRMPVFGKTWTTSWDREGARLLKAKAHGQDAGLVEQFMQEAQFIPETATVDHALQLSLKTHNKLLVAWTSSGRRRGRHDGGRDRALLGREIFDKDDVAVDMRELARTRLQKQERGRRI